MPLTMRPLVTMQPATGRLWTIRKLCELPPKPDDNVLDDRLEQAGHGFFHLVDQFVNDRVKFDLHAFVLGLVGHAAVDARVETENDRVGRGGERNVRFGDRADGAVDDFERNFVGFDFLERFDNGFDRALRVGFDDDLERLWTCWKPSVVKNIFQSDFCAVRFLAKRFGFLAALLRQVARAPFRLRRR